MRQCLRPLTTINKLSKKYQSLHHFAKMSCTKSFNYHQCLSSLSSSSESNTTITLYKSKYHPLFHKLFIQPYHTNKTHIWNALVSSGVFYSLYEFDVDVNWFFCVLWIMGSSYLSYSSHQSNLNHKPCVIYKIEWDSEKKRLLLWDHNHKLVDTITDLHNLIIDHEMEYKFHTPLAGFFWKSFLLNRMDMSQKYGLKFLNYNPYVVKRRIRERDLGISKEATERMRDEGITVIDPELGVMKQFVYTVVNDNPQVLKELRDDLVELKAQETRSH